MGKAAIQEGIVSEGQKYVDRPVVALPVLRSVLELSVSAAFGNEKPLTPIVVRHERIRLRWMKPDGKGGLVPK